MDISESDFEEFGEFPNSELAENVNDSLVISPVYQEEVCIPVWKRKDSRWNRPIAKVYNDNFGFAVNGYQPMIDYLDFKDLGGRCQNPKVHLPFIEERCLHRYSSRNPFKRYKNTDIDRYILKGEQIRTQIRQNDAACLSNILNRTHTNWSMTTKAVQRVKYSAVSDPRERLRESDSCENYSSLNYNPSLAGMSSYSSLGLDPIVASRVAQCKSEYDTQRTSRKSRMDDLDKELDSTLESMRNTVETIPQPSFAARGPYGEVLTDGFISDPDDMLLRNRFRREEDMNSLKAHVDRITRYDDSRSGLRSHQTLRDDELKGAISSLRKKQANTTYSGLGAKLDRIRADRNASRPYTTAIDSLEDDVFLDYLLKKELSQPSGIEDYRKPLSTLLYKADNISDVQERVHNRANEIIGNTAESRKIRDRSKYINVMDSKPSTSEFELMIMPTRTQSNIDYMARGFSTRGIGTRNYDVDEELYEPYACSNVNSYMDHYSRNAPRPGEKLQSDYARVRQAESRAKERTSLLGI